MMGVARGRSGGANGGWVWLGAEVVGLMEDGCG